MIMKKLALTLMLALLSIVSVSAMSIAEFSNKYQRMTGFISMPMSAEQLKGEGLEFDSAIAIIGEATAATINEIKADIASIPEEQQLGVVTADDGSYMAVLAQPAAQEGKMTMVVVTLKDNAVMMLDGICDKAVIEKAMSEMQEEAK